MTTHTSDSSAEQTKHVVVLIPGFLGFNKFGDHGYFNEIVGKELDDALQRPGRGSIEVVVANTIPAGSLETRQKELIGQLKARLEKDRCEKFHLVGHSTGGLDAELLARRPLRGADTNHDLRKSILSIITIASPLAGTSLASSPAAKALSIDSPLDLKRLGRASLASLLYRAPSAIVSGGIAAVGLFSDTAARSLVRGLFHDLPAASSYLRSLAIMRSLISDLEPESVVARMRSTKEDPTLPIHRARFLTISPEIEDPTLKERFFNLYSFFYTNTKEYAQQEASLDKVRGALEAKLNASPSIPVIRSEIELPKLSAGASDAIVNTLRQVAPGEDDEDDATIALEVSRVRAIVVADHIDVVGYFPHDNEDNGFLSSGAQFREPQLKALYRAVAQEVDRAIRSSEPTGPSATRTVSRA